MTFNSYSFLVFFGLVLLLSRVIRNWTLNKAFLLAVSYVFYGAWNPPFVLLLLASTVIDWYSARWIHALTSPRARRAAMGVSLLANLGMLGYFKYAGLAVRTWCDATSLLGFDCPLSPPDIILPVGISFYTFQTLSYTLDVYLRRSRPWHSFLDYALYVTFFPQLVAGPIVRAADFLPQCDAPRKGTGQQIGWGLSLMVIGLFAKVVVADALMAPVVELVYAGSSPPGFVNGWAGTMAFALQIFADFFGYSTCAIGAALCLGFHLMENFRFPYAAIGFSDFWRRWHISLSTWLRDYLYIPLGGNRGGSSRTHLNLALTMLIGGLWHGASWTFVVWGGLHGAYLIAERLVRGTRVAALGLWGSPVGRAALLLSTFLLVCVAWVFFRAPDIDSALSILGGMLSPSQAAADMAMLVSGASSSDPSGPVFLGRKTYAIAFGGTAAMILLHNALKECGIEGLAARTPWPVRSVVLAVLAYLVVISMSGDDRAFIYFQF